MKNNFYLGITLLAIAAFATIIGFIIGAFSVSMMKTYFFIIACLLVFAFIGKVINKLDELGL